MKSWKRIALVIFVLIGGAAFFGYWSIDQFDQVFDSLAASHAADTHSVFRQNAGLASTSRDISGELATSTDNAGLASTSIDISGELATSSRDISGELATVTDPELSFIFPQEADRVYIGCVHQISWQSSTAIDSLETALVDSGTREPAGPIASGLAKENTIDKDLQNLEWKVGTVWPGWYYIKVSKINGVEAEFRSEVFEVSEMPEGLSCEGSVESQ